MLYVAQVAVCSQINTKQFPLMTVPPSQTVLQCSYFPLMTLTQSQTVLSTDDSTFITGSTAKCSYFPLMTLPQSQTVLQCPYFPLMTVLPSRTVLQSVLTFHWCLYLHHRQYCKVFLLSIDDSTSITDNTAKCSYFPLMTLPPSQTLLQSVLTFHWWLYLHHGKYCKVFLLSTDDCTLTIRGYEHL
jgi:Zn-finger protein